MRITVIIVVVLIAICSLVFIRLAHHKTAKSFKNTNEYVQWAASEAVSDAEKNNHVHLDYREASIKDVEDILSQLHDQYSKNSKSISPEGLANAYGAYIGETIRRNEPNVSWESGDAIAGDRSYPLIWAAGRSYPMAWCYHRILNGEEDNVWVKYSVLKNRTSPSEKNASPPKRR
jgi:hypothetical protein